MIARFFCPDSATTPQLASGRTVTLPAAVAHHAVKVLRLRVGDALVLFDGRGGEYAAEIVAAGREVQVRVDAWHATEREAPLRISLLQALPSGDKMDLVMQKAVELGVSAIQPVLARRSVVRLTGPRAERRMAHWRQVVISACEQSGRNRLPLVHDLQDLPDCLANLTNLTNLATANTRSTTPSALASPVLRLLLAPHRGQPLSKLLQENKAIRTALVAAAADESTDATDATDAAKQPELPAVQLLIGPEGGFEEAEEDMALAAGFQAVQLGPRILRTETAGLAALAALMALWGDF